MTDTITPAQYKAMQATKPTKYKNRPVYECRGCQQTNGWVHYNGSRLTTCPGCGYDAPLRFDSQAEWQRWRVLREMERAGEIISLRRQVRYYLRIADKLIATYIADFDYFPKPLATQVHWNQRVVEDVKSKPTRTQAYIIKKKLMEALHGIVISEVQ